jgi:hypothetical protein
LTSPEARIDRNRASIAWSAGSFEGRAPAKTNYGASGLASLGYFLSSDSRYRILTIPTTGLRRLRR